MKNIKKDYFKTPLQMIEPKTSEIRAREKWFLNRDGLLL